MDSATYNLLLSWLAAGAPAPRADDPMLQSVETFPPSRSMQPNEKLPLKVVAKYSDGSARDVTLSCRLEMLNEHGR